jgi:hypothetical protein
VSSSTVIKYSNQIPYYNLLLSYQSIHSPPFSIAIQHTIKFKQDTTTPNMQRIIAFLFVVVPSTFGWMEPQQHRLGNIVSQQQQQQRPFQLPTLASSPNPCWQDLYDDDCAMEDLFQARYVASEWIKKLPCAAGVEVRNETSTAKTANVAVAMYHGG